MVTFSLLVTSSPSPPVPCPWSLKLRIVLSGPWPRTVTPLTSSESVERKSNRPAPNSMTSPGLALIIAAWAFFGASGPGSIRIMLVLLTSAGESPTGEPPVGTGCSEQPATNTTVLQRTAVENLMMRTTVLPVRCAGPLNSWELSPLIPPCQDRPLDIDSMSSLGRTPCMIVGGDLMLDSLGRDDSQADRPEEAGRIIKILRSASKKQTRRTRP